MICSTIRSLVESSPHITPFQRRVYLALLEIPKKQTITYRELGERIQCRSAQAIGQALRRNPFGVGCPILSEYRLLLPNDTDHVTSTFLYQDTFTLDFCVPCHRVIASSGAIGGFCGHREGTEVDRKRQLLLQEGVILP